MRCELLVQVLVFGTFLPQVEALLACLKQQRVRMIELAQQGAALGSFRCRERQVLATPTLTLRYLATSSAEQTGEDWRHESICGRRLLSQSST